MRVKLFLITFTIVCINEICYGYPWPISSFTGPHPINGTFGEFRMLYGNLSYHFHYGVDIGCSSGTSVYPVADGKITDMSSKYIEDGWVEVGNFRYVHINLYDSLEPGQQCIAGMTFLGKLVQ